VTTHSPTRPTLSRRRLIQGAAALASATALAPAFAARALAQAAASAGPVMLQAAPGSLPELAGQGAVALFNGTLPGPVLRLKKGAPLAASLGNGLGAPLSLVWQGVRTADGADPNTVIAAPGGSAAIGFTPRDAGTYWYHAADPALARRALAGALVVEEAGAPLYAADHLLFIQSFPPESGVPLFPVNGSISPTLQGPATGRTRLRLVNATPLFLRLRVKAPALYVIAVDGQPAEPFAPKDSRIQLAPGARIDLAVTLDAADPAIVEIETSQSPIQLAIVNPVGPAGPMPSGPPAALPSNGLPSEMPFTEAARFTINLGEAGPVAAPPSVGSVKAGRVVVLTLENPLDAPLAVRIDGHPVRLLDAVYDGWSPWWHDTVPVPAKGTARVAFKAETPGKWSIVAQHGGNGAVVAARTYQVTA